MQVPQTKIEDVAEIVGDTTVHDPYRWLEENAAPDVREWVEQENTYTQSFLVRIKARQNIKKRLGELFELGNVGVPYPEGGRYFFMERKGGQDLSVLYVQDGLQGAPRVLIDQNMLSPDKKTVVSEWFPSKDGKLLAYGLSKTSNDRESIHVMDVLSGKDLADEISEEIYPDFCAWSPDNGGFWYVRRDPNAPQNSEEKFYKRIFYHKLGEDSANDELVFGEGREKTDYLFAATSEDGRWLLAGAYVSTSEKPHTELYIKDLGDVAGEFKTVVEGKEGLFEAMFHRGLLYIHTNYEAPNWKVVSVPAERAHEGLSAWKTIVQESENVIERVVPVKDSIFVIFLENVHSVFREYKLDGSLRHEVPLPSIGAVTNIGAEDEGDELFFGFTSFVVPHNIYHLEIKSGEIKLFRSAESGIDEKNFQVEQVWYSSKDGTRIPMFVVYKTGTEQNGKNPTVLYGYGGFNSPLLPNFNKTRVPFLEAGGIYAMANIRGGSEFGEKWHEGGMRKNKQNVFDDFIAAAEFLIKEKYTSKDKLAIFGWSNGGLLTGACLTQRPDLYKAVVVGNPVLDMLRYHLFDGGRLWIPDYGSAEETDMVPYLLKYSPYHNVKDGTKYPATLILTSDSDDRVHPGAAYKMTARLQKANASENPILLRVEAKAGHGGGVSVPAISEQYADIWSFVFWQLGISEIG